jgi:uncharacterized protein (TIGR00369 family)
MGHAVRPPRTTGHLQQIRAFANGDAAPPPIAQLMGYIGTRVEIGSVILELDADERHHNQMGTVAGGVIADLCDAAIGIAMATTIEDDEGFTVLDLTTKFLKAVPHARLRATHLTREPGVCREDIFIGVVEVAPENWWAHARYVDEHSGLDTRTGPLLHQTTSTA